MITEIAAKGRQRKSVLLSMALALVLSGGIVAPATAQDLQNLPAGASQLLQQYMQNQQPGGTTNVPSPVDQARGQGSNIGVGLYNQSNGMPQGLNQFSQSAIEAQILSDQLKQQKLQRLLEKQNYCAGDTTLTDEAQLRVENDISATEKDYCQRARIYLQQFGYDVFKQDVQTNTSFNGAVPDSYELGIGDEIIAIFHGTNSNSVTTQVDREGRVILPNMRPIPAAGRTFGDFRRDVEARVKSELLGTDVYVSLGKVKSISVLVAGEVEKPGLLQLTSMSSIVDALMAAGGVKKTGSLRHIQVFHGKKAVNVDLYDLLLGKNAIDVTLREGDRIVVPVIGPTIALLGDVKRRGIYELPGSGAPVSMRAALDLSGGTLRPTGFSIVVSRFSQAGTQTVEQVSMNKASAYPGDVINILRTRDNVLGGVTLAGYVTVPGMRSLVSAPTVRDLLGDANVFKSNPYLLFGVLESKDPDTHALTLRGLNLQRILDGKDNMPLRDKDKVIILGADDIAFLVSNTVRQVVYTGRYMGDCAGLKNLARLVSDTRSDRFVAAIRSVILDSSAPNGSTPADAGDISNAASAAGTINSANVPSQLPSDVLQNMQNTQSGQLGAKTPGMPPKPDCPKIYDGDPEVLSFMLEHIVSVNGEVQNPGVYPVTDGTDLGSIVAVAGGLTNRADLTKVEFMQSLKDSTRGTSTLQRHMLNIASIDAKTVTVDPGSILRFNSLLSDQERGAVELAGEFVRPGLYTITKGERLSELIERAGGLTAQAYPYAAVFTRQSVKQAQEDGFKRSARELTNALASAVLAGDASPSALGSIRGIAVQLQQAEAVGRMVIEADPAVLRVRKDLDTVLEPGDRIYMPKRPNFVSVVGDVLNPGSLQFTPGKSVKEYLGEAGGLQKSADKKRVFVVYPNGAAEPASIGAWNFSSTLVPPGSTIVAPKNATPLNFLKLATSLTQILSQLAVSAASIAVISK